jgi:hypothetical protein
MGWLKERVLGEPAAVEAYRRAQRELQAYAPSASHEDETLWRLDMRVLELERTVPYLRRQNVTLPRVTRPRLRLGAAFARS